MPWVTAVLRGQQVFAKARPDGTLAADGGRVEIRYKATDGRAYRAAAANLVVAPDAKVLPDDHCVSADFVAPKTVATDSAAPRKASSAAPTGSSTDGAVQAPAARGKRWIVYADGACSGNPGPAGAGYVVVMPDGKMHEGFEFLGTATNNIAELTAILRAVEAIPGDGVEVVVHTDSKYSIGVLTKGWKPKVNQELIARTKAKVIARGAKLVYVPGHSGVPLNERADQLAREAVTSRRTQGVAISQ